MPDKNKKPSGNNDAGFRNPHNLPTKVCAGCGKPFTWRKKWERDWATVRYCSDACKKGGGDLHSTGGSIPTHK